MTSEGRSVPSAVPVVGASVGYFYSEGMPFRWRDEVGGTLVPAMKAVLRHYSDPTKYGPPVEDEIRLAGEYFHYFICAPIWRDGNTGELARLRNMAAQIRTMDQVRSFLAGCFDLGIDPI